MLCKNATTYKKFVLFTSLSIEPICYFTLAFRFIWQAVNAEAPQLSGTSDSSVFCVSE